MMKRILGFCCGHWPTSRGCEQGKHADPTAQLQPLGQQELQVQQKREVEKAQEATRPTRAFLPNADIFETEEALTVVLEMPGVDRDNINVSVENGLLTIEGRINFSKYEGLEPVYSEYNIGPFRRTFRISSRIDQDKIRAEMRDGVITLVLPKAEEEKPRRIEVK